MTSTNFKSVMDVVFKHEGGYVDHPRDPGGATNMGITHLTLAAHRGKASVTKTQVKNLTKTEARQIYKDRFWKPMKCGHMPDGWDMITMDGGVNSGPKRGIKWVQRAVGTGVDGVVGPKTLASIRSADAAHIKRAASLRMGFLRGLSHWSTFGKGWTRRVAETEAVALKMFYLYNDMEVKRKLGEDIVEANGRKKKETEATAGAPAAAGGGAVGSTQLPIDPTYLIIGLAVIGLGLFVIFNRRRNVEKIRVEELGKVMPK